MLTNMTYDAFKSVLYILTKFGSNRPTISHSCHKNDRSKVTF